MNNPMLLARLCGMSLVILSLAFTVNAEDKEHTSHANGDKSTVADAEVLKDKWHAFNQALKSYSYAQRDQAIDAIKTESEQIKVKAEALERKLSNQTARVSDEITAKRQATLKELKQRQEQLKTWSEKLENSSQDAWVDLKDGFSDAYAILARSFKDAERAFSEPNADKDK